MSTMTLVDKLAQGAVLTSQQPLIIEAETGAVCTYAQCLASVTAMRAYLGDTPRCILLALPGGILSALTWLSALTGGHLLIPVSPDAPTAEKARLIQRYHPDLLLVEQAGDARDLNAAGARVVTREDIYHLLWRYAPNGAESPLPRVGQVCLQTSGSTGEPKGVILDERQIAWAAEHISASHRLTPDDIGLTVLPFFHVNAPIVSFCASLVAGSTVVLARRFSRRNFWAWVERYAVTWASIVPTIVAILLDTAKPAFLPGRLRFARTASSPLPASHLRAFEAQFGIPLIETYGLTEAASQIAANPVPPGLHKAGSVGLPVGVALRICAPRAEADGEQMSLVDVVRGEMGEICVRGPSVIHAYQDNAGQQSFQHGWFRTGDLGYQDADGYIFITGRLRDVIIRGGENIAPREVEEALASHPAVRDVAVVGRPDPLYGEVVVAYVVAQDGVGDTIIPALREHAAQRLSPPKMPVDFILVAALPRTASGKIARQRLREQEVSS